MPKVYNKHHKNAPADAVYIGRRSPWGNPYSHQVGTTAQHKVATREEAVAMYEHVVTKHLRETPGFRAHFLNPLIGKDLVCFCAPASCHGDVLLRLANNPPIPGELA